VSVAPPRINTLPSLRKTNQETIFFLEHACPQPLTANIDDPTPTQRPCTTRTKSAPRSFGSVPTHVQLETSAPALLFVTVGSSSLRAEPPLSSSLGSFVAGPQPVLHHHCNSCPPESASSRSHHLLTRLSRVSTKRRHGKAVIATRVPTQSLRISTPRKFDPHKGPRAEKQREPGHTQRPPAELTFSVLHHASFSLATNHGGKWRIT
jgi:hypothetical protein